MTASRSTAAGWAGLAFLVLAGLAGDGGSAVAQTPAGAAQGSGSAAQAPSSPTPSTREAELTALQEEKAKHLTPEGPSRVELYIRRLEPVALGTAPSGFYPWFGNVMGGGWMAFGAGYRHVYRDTGVLNVFGGWSLKNYRMVQADLGLPTFLDGRGRIAVHGKYLFADKVSFYGLGNDSSQDDRSSFKYEPTTLGANVEFEPLPSLFVGGGYWYERVDTGEGNKNPSIEDAFTPDSAPGLGQDARYDVTHAHVAVDWREGLTYSTKGGLYRVEYRRYDERSGKPYSFDWTEAEVRQFLPILRANWVLAFRGVVTMTDSRDGSEVPYFMMPTLGSSRDLRGFNNRRFRDENRLLLQGEVRWRPSKFADFAVFYDTGKAVPTRSQLDFDDLKSGYGAGVRLHGPTFTVLRFDVAKSREGLSFIVTSGIF